MLTSERACGLTKHPHPQSIMHSLYYRRRSGGSEGKASGSLLQRVRVLTPGVQLGRFRKGARYATCAVYGGERITRIMLRGGVGRLAWGVRPGRVGSRVSWQRLCQTTTPAPAPEPAKFSRALLGGTLLYTGVSVSLGYGWLMAGGPPEVGGLVPNIAGLASAAKYNTSVGWATGSAVYGKHIRDVGGILLVMAQAALGKYVVVPIVCFSGFALLGTAVAAGIVDRQHLKKLREAAVGLEEAESGAGKGSEESFREFEESNFEESFRKFDKDGSGVIDRKELRAMIHHLYQLGGRTRKPSDTEIAHFMKMADIDGDGKIDFEEFVLFMKKLEAIREGRQRRPR